MTTTPRLGRSFLALGDPPPGFEVCAEIDPRRLRGGLVALWAPALEPARAELEPLRDRIRGLLLTVGDEPGRERIGASLWQIQVRAEVVPVLRELAEAWLDVCEAFVDTRRELDRAGLTIARSDADRQRLLEKVDRETGVMRDKLRRRTQWSTRAVAGLVRFAAERLAIVEDDELPAAIVAFLRGEPFVLAEVALLRAGQAGWELLARAGDDAADTELRGLPAPGTSAGLSQPTPTTALLSIGTAGREQQLLLRGRDPFDEADRSFFSVFMLMLAGNLRARELHRELRSALGQRDGLIRELSSPVIQVWSDTVCLPVVGSVDRARALDMSEVLLAAVAARKIRHVIIDFTAIGLIDTQTVHHFAGLARALGMIGARCIMTGISPAVAQTMVSLGVDLGEVQTLRSVEDALTRLLGRAGGTPRPGSPR